MRLMKVLKLNDDKEECIDLSFGQDVEDTCMIEKNDTF